MQKRREFIRTSLVLALGPAAISGVASKPVRHYKDCVIVNGWVIPKKRLG